MSPVLPLLDSACIGCRYPAQSASATRPARLAVEVSDTRSVVRCPLLRAPHGQGQWTAVGEGAWPEGRRVVPRPSDKFRRFPYGERGDGLARAMDDIATA